MVSIPTARVFKPLLEKKRFKGAHGGRGSGKSQFFAGLMVEEHMLHKGLRSVCLRQYQTSIQRSSKQEIVDKIKEFNLENYFDIQDKSIKAPGGGLIIFQGLSTQTEASIKSLAGFNRAWVEEAQSVPQSSWKMLLPTMRAAESEIWASWNPKYDTDAVDKFFRQNKDPRDDMICVEANWADNPWFKNTPLAQDRLYALKNDPYDYDWVWEGAYKTVGEACIFRGKFEIKEFDTPDDVIFLHGADFGYSNDPTALIRCFIKDRDLYIDEECYSTGIEIDFLPDFFSKISTSRTWQILADGSSPQIISHLYRHGFNIRGAKKWPKSVEEGITFIRGFRNIYIHPRCENTAKEFRMYSWKVDPMTGSAIPRAEDKNNHAIDAIRYALNEYITQDTAPVFKSSDVGAIMQHANRWRR